MNVYYISILSDDSDFRRTVLKTLVFPPDWKIKVKEWKPLINPSIHGTNHHHMHTSQKQTADVLIALSPKRLHYKTIKGKRVYFSVTFIDRTPPLILIDPYNYMYGVKQSGLSIEKYRSYVIIHEFLHAIGFDHLPCRAGKVCPVLYQMTRGIPKNSKPSFHVTSSDRKSKCRKGVSSQLCRERLRSK